MESRIAAGAADRNPDRLVMCSNNREAIDPQMALDRFERPLTSREAAECLAVFARSRPTIVRSRQRLPEAESRRMRGRARIGLADCGRAELSYVALFVGCQKPRRSEAEASLPLGVPRYT